MHTISPYSVRCRDNNVYCVLNTVRSKDILSLLHDFIVAKSHSVTRENDSKQAYIFEGIQYEPNNRKIHGWFKVGSYGTSGEIINITSGSLDFTKTPDNADLIRHYFQFYLPLNVNEGFCIFHSYRGNGVKTLFSKIFAPYFDQGVGA